MHDQIHKIEERRDGHAGSGQSNFSLVALQDTGGACESDGRGMAAVKNWSGSGFFGRGTIRAMHNPGWGASIGLSSLWYEVGDLMQEEEELKQKLLTAQCRVLNVGSGHA